MFGAPGALDRVIRCHRNKGVQLFIEPCDAFQTCARQLYGEIEPDLIASAAVRRSNRVKSSSDTFVVGGRELHPAVVTAAEPEQAASAVRRSRRESGSGPVRLRSQAFSRFHMIT